MQVVSVGVHDIFPQSIDCHGIVPRQIGKQGIGILSALEVLSYGEKIVLCCRKRTTVARQPGDGVRTSCLPSYVGREQQCVSESY